MDYSFLARIYISAQFMFIFVKFSLETFNFLLSDKKSLRGKWVLGNFDS